MTMSIKTDVKQNFDKIAESPAFHLVAGVGNLAVEKLRAAQAKLAGIDVQAKLTEMPQRFAKAQEKAQARIAEVPNRLAALRAEPKAVQEAARQLPERAQDLALQLTGKAVQTYAELAERGRTVVERQRGIDRAGGVPGTSIVEPVEPPATVVPDGRPATAKITRETTEGKTTPPSRPAAKKAATKKATARQPKAD
jgi:hypothetical protein